VQCQPLPFHVKLLKELSSMKRTGLAAFILLSALALILLQSAALGSQSDPSANAEDNAVQDGVESNGGVIEFWGDPFESSSSSSFWPPLRDYSPSNFWRFLRSVTINIKKAPTEYKDAFFAIEFIVSNHVFGEVHAPYLKV
jgi:hypothetical protein